MTPLADLPPFVRGHQAGFDGWRDRGNPGWGYADVLPSFKRLERYEAGASDTRGGDGPLAVAHCWDPHPAHRAFLMACVPSGFLQDSRHDFNGPRSQSVAGYYQKAIRDDRPHTLDAAFLAPARDRGHGVGGSGRTREPRGDRGHARRGRRVRGGRHAPGDSRRARRDAVRRAGARGATADALGHRPGRPRCARRAWPSSPIAPASARNLHDQLRLPLRYPSLQPLPASTVSAGMFTVSLNASPPDLQMDFVDAAAPAARRRSVST